MRSRKILKNLTKEELRELLIEITEIGKKPAPADVKQSPIMRQLFAVHWMNIYSEVEQSITREILDRIIEGWS
jgi:hypothetical protein